MTKMKATVTMIILLINSSDGLGIVCSCSHRGSVVKAKLCSSNWCYQSEGNDYSNKLIHVKYAKVDQAFPVYNLEKCSFSNLTSLVTIDGASAGITDIEPCAFWSLRNVQKISLPFNLITSLKSSVFGDVTSLESLDLSWNKIYRIDTDVFDGLRLTSLNLSRNELTFFIINEQFSFVRELILSHNFLHEIEFRTYFNTMPPVLKILDLSFNKLKISPGLNCFTPASSVKSSCGLDELDLSHNLLTSVRGSGSPINHLNISFNKFTDPFTFLTKVGDIKSVAIFPNPWDCSVLEQLLMILTKRKTKISRHHADFPVCTVASKEALQTYEIAIDGYNKISKCTTDIDCPSDTVCRAKKCDNPCQYNPCTTDTEICTTERHNVVCACPKGKLKDPKDFYSRCFNVECFTNSDCQNGLKCKRHVCI